MSAFGGARNLQPKPPEKGIFPLDHFGECATEMQDYLRCLKEHKQDATLCRDASKRYLQCRMDKNLMAKQDLSDLGFSQESSKV